MQSWTTSSRRNWLRACMLGAAAAASFLAPEMARAQDWPTRPVKLVVAFAAGSTGDTLARLLAPRLEAAWKQSVIVENRPGAGGVVGTEYVARATDGHTLLLGTLSSLLPKYTVKDLRYDPLTDIVPVYRLVNYHLVIAANTKTAQKAPTLMELVELSKSSPKGLFFGGSGTTSIFNLSMTVMNKSLGMRYTPVDFNNIGAITLAVLRDDAQFMVNSVSAISGQIDSGEVRPIAAISNERFPSLPNVPTVIEAGYKGFVPWSWGGIFVPKGTPAPVVDRIGRDLLAIMSDADARKSIESRVSGTMLRSSPAAFVKEYQEEARIWRDVFASMNYVPQ